MNIARLAIVFEVGATDDFEELVCTMHVRASDEHEPPSSDDLVDLGVAVTQWWGDDTVLSDSFTVGPAANLYSDLVRLNRIELMRVEPTVGAVYTHPGENAAGIALSFDWGLGVLNLRVRQFPPQVCWLICPRTLDGSRAGNGRLYLPATDFDGGSFTPFNVDPKVQAVGRIHPYVRGLLARAMGALHTRLRWATGTEFEYVWAVYSRTSATSHAVTRFEVSDYLRTQRRRTRYPGTHTLYGVNGV